LTHQLQTLLLQKSAPSSGLSAWHAKPNRDQFIHQCLSQAVSWKLIRLLNFSVCRKYCCYYLPTLWFSTLLLPSAGAPTPSTSQKSSDGCCCTSMINSLVPTGCTRFSRHNSYKLRLCSIFSKKKSSDRVPWTELLNVLPSLN
jgi:hypothetical protein